MTTQEFEIPVPGKFARMFPLFIGLAVPLVLLALLATTAPPAGEWPRLLASVLILPCIAGVLVWSIYRRRIWLREGSLGYGFLPWQRVALAALDLDAARVLNLDDAKDLQPVLKLAGIGLPGYRSGWFWLRNRRRAYVVLTQWQRVLMLPRRDGVLILLSLQRPDALLAALQRAGG